MNSYYGTPYYMEKKKTSSSSKIIALILIFMLVGTGLLALLIRTDGSNGVILPPEDRVRVAVLDSGIDID